MSDDAIQDLIDECEYPPGDSHDQPRVAVIARAQAQHTANRDTIASLRSSLEGRAAEVAKLHADERWHRQIMTDNIARFIELAKALDVDPEALEDGPVVLHDAIAELKAKVARLESAIADHVIDEGLAVPDDMVAALSCDCDAPWCVKARAEHARKGAGS